jgi:hypothetical protein
LANWDCRYPPTSPAGSMNGLIDGAVLELWRGWSFSS